MFVNNLECMARIILALFQIATWQLTFYAALRYTHMVDELPCEHSWQAKSNDILFNGVHLCDHWIQHMPPNLSREEELWGS